MQEDKRILLIGSEPFGGDPVNPTLEIAKQLSGRTYHGFYYECSAFRVNRRLCVSSVESAIEQFRPQIVICMGLADNRCGVSVERVAINVADFPIADNEGFIAMNEPVVSDGPAAYFSTLPIRAMVEEIRKVGIPAFVSNTAGTFCCNMAMYAALHCIEKLGLSCRAGFLHFPYTPQLAVKNSMAVATMSYEMMLEAVKAATQVAVDVPMDISLRCGTLS